MGLADVAQEVARPRKRMRVDNLPKDKFNISNDQFYEVSKEGGRHRVRQTFGQLVVEHAYPAQKLQLPFVRLIPTLYLVYLFNSSNLVQNSLVETRGAVIPSSRSPISFEYRDSFQQSADSEKEEGQGWPQSGQGRRYWRGSASDRRSFAARHQQLCVVGVLRRTSTDHP